MKRLLLAIALLFAPAAPAMAQEDEIVVTGSRLEGFERLIVPQVTLVRRADFAIIEVEVRSDTRDQSQRLGEIRAALRGLQARSRPDGETLALLDEDAQIVREFSMQAAEDLFTRGQRADTSRVTVLLRTPISAQDTLQSVRERVDRFVAASGKPGRVEMEAGDLDLSMVDPNRFRPQILAAVAADARAVASAMGAGYTPSVGGLQNQVAWQRTGDLELTLFLPYTIEALPSR